MDARSLAMVSLADRDGSASPCRISEIGLAVSFEFRVYASATGTSSRNIGPVDGRGPRTGWTATVAESRWLSDSYHAPLLRVHYPDCRHFIETEDDASTSSPSSSRRSGSNGSPTDQPPGKSAVLYHPEDRKDIDRVFGELAKSGRPEASGGIPAERSRVQRVRCSVGGMARCRLARRLFTRMASGEARRRNLAQVVTRARSNAIRPRRNPNRRFDADGVRDPRETEGQWSGTAGALGRGRNVRWTPTNAGSGESRAETWHSPCW
jgi:hypothetical protein